MKHFHHFKALIFFSLFMGVSALILTGSALDTGAQFEEVSTTLPQATVETQTISGAEQSASTQAAGQAEETGEDVAEEVQNEITQIRELISISKVIYTLIILFLTYFINKYLTLILDNMSEKATNYRLFIKRLAPISRIVIWSFAIYIIIAGIISPPFETVIAIGASVGIAVGFASQDILKNIFGGIIIILDRPFQVGDKIEVGVHYGEVINIGLRSCRVVTPDDSIVSIPNAELMNHSVSNANSSALDCQVVAEIYLPATVDIQQVKKIAYKAVYASSYTFLNKPVDIIVLNEVENRYFVYKLRVKAYVVDIRYEFFFKSDLTEMIVAECNRLGMVPLTIPSEKESN
ncbi:mechanosensitive ion channel family protein [Rhodohalobacter barkolensis]|uniref:Mechanosensitive ion channel protein MscS n=1 Tax=Rhodohalobacter barkolensis TaxID=2053187 RepID=A0A2N0VIX4_9BACT|nr:mechanosensitive ion channel domain-containing protein [Rhodohalobacter barkolensis]PKD44145.1 mechanosensitive ion channel protein MscS [Rhodohalobacter barkolensis]